MINRDDIKTLNSTDNCEVFAREHEKEINKNECLSDEAIARELQEQIRREYDENLIRLEKLQNGTSKLNISYEKYRKCENYDSYGEEPFEDCDQQDNEDWDQFDAVDTKNRDMVTKHAVNLSEQRKMKWLMSLPPNVETVDGAASHIELSNSVLNSLKGYLRNEKVCLKEREQKSKKTSLQGVDQITRNAVYSLFQGCEPYLKRLYEKIGEGKESVIYHGKTAKPYKFSLCRCAVKLYKLDVHDFKIQEKYLFDDYRYKARYHSKISKHEIIYLWAEKEMENLIRLKKHDIPCPQVITLKKDVLVTSLIGSYHWPAIKLKYADLTMEQYNMAYKQIVENMTKMFQNAMLVHTNLSEDNILWYREKCYFVGVGRAVEPHHESYFKYLKRDCLNVIRFFKRKKLEKIMTKEELFEYITGEDIRDSEGIRLLHTSFKNKCRNQHG